MRIIIEFILVVFITYFSKSDLDLIKKNSIIRIGLLIGGVVTGVVFIEAIKFNFPLLYNIFLLIQLSRICYFIGGDFESDASDRKIEIVQERAEEEERDQYRSHGKIKYWKPANAANSKR